MVTQTNICVICFDPIGINKWKCNNCYGVLHRECIHQWKITNPKYPVFYTCPLCKYEYKIYNFVCILNFIKTYRYTLSVLIIILFIILLIISYTVGIVTMFLVLYG